MWPRIAEILIGAWLAVSPWLLTKGAVPSQMAIDVIAGLLFVLFAIIELTTSYRSAHFLSILVALVLTAWGWFHVESIPFSLPQHDILVGLTILVFAIIPTGISTPPEGWQQIDRSGS